MPSGLEFVVEEVVINVIGEVAVIYIVRGIDKGVSILREKSNKEQTNKEFEKGVDETKQIAKEEPLSEQTNRELSDLEYSNEISNSDIEKEKQSTKKEDTLSIGLPEEFLEELKKPWLDDVLKKLEQDLGLDMDNTKEGNS